MCLQVMLLFDNGATVFFAIFMAFWGEWAKHHILWPVVLKMKLYNNNKVEHSVQYFI